MGGQHLFFLRCVSLSHPLWSSQMATNAKYIGFSVTPGLYRKVQKLAREQHRSVSGVMRKMLEDAMTSADEVRQQLGAPLKDIDGVEAP